VARIPEIIVDEMCLGMNSMLPGWPQLVRVAAELL
jgi:hypothetical protein